MKNNKGFSLVELIVVIAIMAILIGVAVPVYSSYVEKTQKAADIQLVDEIKHALQIAAVGDNWYTTLPSGKLIGTIVISDDKTTVSGANADLIHAALEATFGPGYKTELTLSYDGWTGTLGAGGAQSIVNSSYYGKVDVLLEDIQEVTNSLQDFIVSSGSTIMGTDFERFLVENGIDSTDPDSAQAVANMAILYIANSMGSIAEADEGAVKKMFVDTWTTNNVLELGLVNASIPGANLLTKVAAEYARAEAVIGYLNCADARNAFDKYPVAGNDVTAVLNSVESIMNEVATHAYTSTTCNCADKFYDYFESETVKNDAEAYFNLLAQVKASEGIIKSDVHNEDLYSKDELLDYIDSYIVSAEIISTAKEGDVVITVVLNANGILQQNVYPFDYLGVE